MTTKLTIQEFESRLKRLLRNGNPYIMGTPFGIFALNFGDEPFYGETQNEEFRLTNNSLIFSTGAIIEGRYKNSEDKIEIDYSIKITPFAYFWVRFVPILGFVLFNGVLIFNSQPYAYKGNLIVTLIFGLGFLFALWHEKRRLRKLKRMFISKFEIECPNQHKT